MSVPGIPRLSLARILTAGVCVCGLAVGMLLVGSPAAGQGRGNSGASVKALDLKAQKARTDFLRSSAELAAEYEKAGELEKAKVVLESILKLEPEARGVKAKLDSLDAELIQSNPTEVEVDAARGWKAVGVRVFKGRPVRLLSTGRYRFVANGLVGPEGFPTDEPTGGDMAVGIPCGALMGVILSADKRGSGLKPGDPFTIGTETELTPKADGLLYLRVNTPPGSKCTGRIRVQLSGYLRAGS